MAKAQKHKPGEVLRRLKKGKLILAEGYLFELERRGYLKAGAFVPEVVLDYPDAVRELTREFARAGSDIIEAFTYYAHRNKLRVIGREKDLEKMNRGALRIAREIADEYGGIMAGDICNTWEFNPDDPKTHETVRAMFEEQVKWAVEEGADFIIAEMFIYLGEALIALDVVKKYNLPVMVNLTAGYPKSKDGYDWVEACKILEKNGADIVGFNCQTGPEVLLPLLKKVRKAVKCYVSALPVPYHTTKDKSMWYLEYKGANAFPLALDPFVCTRGEAAQFAKEAEKIGIDVIGLCCGAAPHHIRAMAEAMGRTVPASKYSPDVSQHGLFGTEKVVKKFERKLKQEKQKMKRVKNTEL